MVWRRWRGLIGGGIAALLLSAPTTVTLAQTASPMTSPAPAKIASKPVKPAEIKPPANSPSKSAAKKPAPAHPAKQLATAKVKAPIKKVAAAPRKEMPAKRITVAAKKPAEPTRIAAVAAKPALPSYTVTTTRGGVTTTATRIVPLTSIATTVTTPAAPEAQVAALPVSLTEPAAPVAEKPMTSLPEQPAAIEKPPATTATPAPEVKGAVSFVSSFLKAAFHIAKSADANSLQRRAQLADLFASKMDVKRIAGYTTSDELTGVSADIQRRFRTILVSYLVETYYPRLELASDPSVAVETTPAEALGDGTVVVWTTFTKEGWGSQSIKWHLAAEDGGFKIVDILSSGASLVQMERDTFLSVMRNGGLSELMAKLDARTKELATAATE